MNTIFKFHFETWLLFSLAGALAWETFRASKKLAWRVAIVLTGWAALYTSVTAFAGFLRLDRGGWPRGTLDGTAYLEKQDPGDRGAIEWMNANVRGLPVLLEAHGPSYQDFRSDGPGARSTARRTSSSRTPATAARSSG